MNILGIGNALVDILIRIDDDIILDKLELPRASMQLISFGRSEEILSATKHFKKSFASGGSAANTITGVAGLGLNTSFIGKVGKDKMGRLFKNDLEKLNINPVLFYSDTYTGTAATLISRDSERTLATYLGAAIELSVGDLTPELFSKHDFCYVEGYLVQDHSLLERIMDLAKKNHLKILFDLASYNVVEENVDFLKYIVKNYVDIVFANEQEAEVFTGKSAILAIDELALFCEIAVVKLGKSGSMIKSGIEFHKIGVIDVKSVDTTGAGDQYAAGFIYGLSQGYNLKKCGEIAATMSGKVVEHYGARLLSKQWKEMKEMITRL